LIVFVLGLFLCGYLIALVVGVERRKKE